MSTVHQVAKSLEEFAPLSLQEHYDNSGLLVGDPTAQVKGILVCIDSTEEVVDEAIRNNCNMIIAHHPILFKGLKSLTGQSYIERTVVKAIKNDVAIYACHTNADNVLHGVNAKIAEKLGLVNCSILQTKSDLLKKLVTYVPQADVPKVREALFNAGAGAIGKYDMCSFNVGGYGTFRAGEGANPFVGRVGEMHKEAEERIEVIFDVYKQSRVLNALLGSHPYEEVAYDVYSLDNAHQEVGSGMIGELASEIEEKAFLEQVKSTFGISVLRHTSLLGKKVKKVAVCGGSGSFLLKKAISAGADVFISADFKYHEFFDTEEKLVIADVGHYESEQYTVELFYEHIKLKFPTFAVHFSKTKTNPINYF